VSDPGAALFGTSAETLKAYYLSSIDVFRDLARSEVERLAQTTRMITCPRGRTIYRAGEANEALFLLKTGRVQIARESGDGKRLISAVLGPHTFFGEMALVGQRFPQDSTAEAIEDALICVLSRKDLEGLVLQHPKVGLRFLEQLKRGCSRPKRSFMISRSRASPRAWPEQCCAWPTPPPTGRSVLATRSWPT
jgi:CRP-like cAMP-binding protein